MFFFCSRSWPLGEARAAILAEWRREVNRTIGTTQTRLRDLAQDTVRETGQRVANNGRRVANTCIGTQVANNGKRVAAVEARTMRSLDMAVLLQDLDTLFSLHTSKKPAACSRIPIYGSAHGLTRGAMQTQGINWWQLPAAIPLIRLLSGAFQPALTMSQQQPQTEQEVLDILKDFTVDQRDRKTIESEWSQMEENTKTTNKVVVERRAKKDVKEPRRGSNSALRMLARREEKRKEMAARHSYKLKEFQASNGESHFIVVKSKKEEEKAKTTVLKDVEDFFADWRVNLQRRRAQRHPRSRKLSHRAERRQIIQSAVGPTPQTYAQALQRNLKSRAVEQPSVEEIFSSFNTFVEEEFNRICNDEPAAPQPATLDMGDIFFPFRHNFHVPTAQPEDVDILATAAMLPFAVAAVVVEPPFDCGQPTVLTAKPKSQPTRTAVTAEPAGCRQRPQHKQLMSPATTAKQVKAKKRLQQQPLKQQPQHELLIHAKKQLQQQPVQQPLKQQQQHELFIHAQKQLQQQPVQQQQQPRKQQQLQQQPVQQQQQPLKQQQLQQQPAQQHQQPLKQQQLQQKPVQQQQKPVQQQQKPLKQQQPQQELLIHSKKQALKPSQTCPKPVPAVATVLPSWHGRLGDQRLPAAKTVNNFCAELIFADWLQNFREPIIITTASQLIVNSGYEASFFVDWCHNFTEPAIAAPLLAETGSISPKSSFSGQKRRLHEEGKKKAEMEEEEESSKDERRVDYAKNVRIRDKKRTDVQRRSAGQRVAAK